MLPLLLTRPGSRVILVASDMHLGGVVDWSDLDNTTLRGTSNALTVYSNSKLAMVLYAQQLAVRHPCLCVLALTPGFVETYFLKQTSWFERATTWLAYKLIAATPEQGAQSSIWAATAPEAGVVTGSYGYVRHCRKTVSSHTVMNDGVSGTRLWAETRKRLAEAGAIGIHETKFSGLLVEDGIKRFLVIN